MVGTATKVGLRVAVGCGIGLLVSGALLAEPGESAPEAPDAGTPAVGGFPQDEDSLWAEPDDLVPGGEVPHSRFAKLARAAAPGIVNVHTSKTVVRTPFPFFGLPQLDPAGPQQEFSVPSMGTGFVLSANGHIVTNNHVVEGVDQIRVIFSDGSEAPAKIVGQDPKTDLALIRVLDRTDLHVLPLGDSDAILPGDWVIAIGNPFGLDHTVTAGIVSAKGRDIGQGPYDDFIQTDAAINPGNSGGPLLDMNGHVVGINTAINPRANTIGFAVPINLAKEILPQLREHGRVTRGWLGVAVQRLTPELAQAFGLESESGGLISQLAPGGPADAAGIERGDVIVAYDGEPVGKVRDLPRAVSRTPVGTRVPIEIVRGGEHKTFTVEIGKLDEPAAGGALVATSRGAAAFGLQVQNLTTALRERLGIDARLACHITL